MIQIFTPTKQLTVNQSIKEANPVIPFIEEPSAVTIQNILNFSRNLNVKPSKLLGFFETVQS